MNATLTTASDHFVPPEVREYIGGPKVRAYYKVKPEDFIVEERTQVDHLCTISQESDLTPEQIARLNETGRPGLVGLTVVKYKRTQYDVVDDLSAKVQTPKDWLTFAGMKDYQAWCSSRKVYANVHMDDIRELEGKKFEHGDGWWMIKDVTGAAATLENGNLVSNRFTLRVLLPGMTAEQIMEYVNKKLDGLRKLAADIGKDLGRGDFGSEAQILIPNAFGGQRDGRRRNLKDIGETLWRKGARAAVRRFVCENSGNECQLARKIRKDLDDHWGWLEFSEKTGNQTDATQYFQEMLRILEQPHPHVRETNGKPRPSFEVLSMTVEHEILKKLSTGMSFEDVMGTMYKKFSLWIGAFQSYWFNQVLARVLRKEIVLRGSGSIPLLTCSPEAIRFYQRYCPEALPLRGNCQKPQPNRQIGEWMLEVDPTVKRMFLSPRRSDNGRDNSPWRKALIPVIGLTHRAEDGVWYPQFELRSGAYATVLLECLFDIDQKSGRSPDHGSDRRSRHGRGWRQP